MLVDMTNFGLVHYNIANFYQSEETSSYWSVKPKTVFCFSLVNQRHTCGITVYNRTVTNNEYTVRAVHSCNGWFCYIISFLCEKCNYMALIGGGGSDQFTASEKFGTPNFLSLTPLRAPRLNVGYFGLYFYLFPHCGHVHYQYKRCSI